jgi:hypothetical protein
MGMGLLLVFKEHLGGQNSSSVTFNLKRCGPYRRRSYLETHSLTVCLNNICTMESLRTKDKVALVIAILTAIAALGNGGGAIDLLIGVLVNVGIVYGVAAILDFFRNQS